MTADTENWRCSWIANLWGESRSARRAGRRVVFAAMLLASGAVGLATAQHPQQEEPIPCNELGEPVQLRYGSHTNGCSISPGVDLDLFQFHGCVGDSVRFFIRGYTANLDPLVAIRDPGLALLHEQSCVVGVGNTCGFAFEPATFSEAPSATLSATGQYLMSVEDAGSNQTGTYQFSMERLPPLNCPPALNYNAPVADTIGFGSDTDLLYAQLRSGTLVRFDVAGLSSNLDPKIEVMDATGAVVASDSCFVGTGQTCTFQLQLVPAATGRYLIAVSDLNFDQTGSYQLAMHCLTANCPPDLMVRNVTFLSTSELTWDSVAPANATYDVVRGNLGTLRINGGPFSCLSAGDFSDSECLTSGGGNETATDPSEPLPGQGFYYLVRARSGQDVGRYDNAWGPAQVCGRDERIASAPNACATSISFW